MLKLHPGAAYGDDIRKRKVVWVSLFGDAASWAKFDIWKNLPVGFERAKASKQIGRKKLEGVPAELNALYDFTGRGYTRNKCNFAFLKMRRQAGVEPWAHHEVYTEFYCFFDLLHFDNRAHANRTAVAVKFFC